jgi:amino acid adenylation domain-containing protein
MRQSMVVDNVSELLRIRADRAPADEAFTFLAGPDEPGPDTRVDYAGLDRAARAIAARLGRKTRGERALLLYPPGPEYVAAFFGCLYADVLAVPVYPPDMARWDRSVERIRAIALDAGATLALTTTALLDGVRAISSQFDELRSVTWCSTDDAEPADGDDWQPLVLGRDTPAFLQYTSGSTAAPKGVVLDHGNLLSNLAAISAKFGLTPDSRGVIWLPPYHDMGLIGGVLGPIHGGFPVTLMSPLAFLRDPIRWLRTISETGATRSGGPNFAYELCARKITDDDRQRLDLSHWELAFCGAEPVRPGTLESFADAFASCGFRRDAFYPCYGLAESTLLVTGGAPGAGARVARLDPGALGSGRAVASADAGQEVVSCGTVAADHDVVVVAPGSGLPVPDGSIGEVLVSGPSVARGYWNSPDATARTFGVRLDDSVDRRDWLRTGDMGFLDGGELFVLGRWKDMLVVHGRNYHPEDIEPSVYRSHPALRPGCCAVFQAPDTATGAEIVVAVQEVRAGIRWSAESVADAIRQAVVSAHELTIDSVVLVQAGTIAKTSSGKIRRRACRDAFLSGTLTMVAPPVAVTRDVTAPTVALGRLRERPAVDTAVDYVAAVISSLGGLAATDGTATLVEQGLDSLAMVEMHGRIQHDLGVDLELGAVLGGGTLETLGRRVLDAMATTPQPVAGGGTELTRGQRAMWVLEQLAPGRADYTISRAVRLRGALSIEALRSALAKLVARHEALRTTFDVVDGEPVRVVHDHLELDIERHDGAARPSTHRFDLGRGPLLHVELLRDQVLVLTVHHIVVDFWSLHLLVDELGTLLDEPDAVLPAAGAFGDYVALERDYLARPAAEIDWEYWKGQLAGTLPELKLPTGESDPNGESECRFELSPELTRAAATAARLHHTTVYVLLLAVYETLLHRLSGQDDIVVGTHVADRGWPGAAATVGYCVNTLPLRTDFSADPTFAALLSSVDDTVRAALAHHRLPFPVLVDRLAPPRRPGQTPIFQATFGFLAKPLFARADLVGPALHELGRTIALGPLTAEVLPLTAEDAQFALSLVVGEVGGRLVGRFQHDGTQLRGAALRRLTDSYVWLLKQVLADPELHTTALTLLGGEERAAVLAAANGPVMDIPGDTLGELVARQALRVPDRVAVRHRNGDLTYRQLDEQANRIANLLLRKGIRTEDRVAVRLDRTPVLIATLLGILKTGAAYVPLDPRQPAHRTETILRDAKPTLLISTEPSAVDTVPGLSIDDQMLTDLPATDPGVEVRPRNLAYLLYTSGSTGVPKGVAIEHRSAVNLVAWARTRFTTEELARTVAATSICFDLSIFEIFTPLASGTSVTLVDNPLAITADTMATLINTVPSAITELLDNDAIPRSVHTINLAGEPLTASLIQRLHNETNARRVVNLYGPSETTTYSTFTGLPGDVTDPVSIGTAVANSQAHVLDGQLQPVPTGVAGELFLGGAGLARGYFGQPALTAERFVPDPFTAGAGQRLYRTGDLVRRHADGHLEFIGRADHQIKLRGYRIELGEIETVLRGHAAVREAIVQPHGEQRSRRLVAYLTTAGTPDPEALAAELRQHVATRLPHYMVPTSYLVLEQFPLNANGKIDRGRLPAPDGAVVPNGQHVPPRTPTEGRVTALLASVLGHDQVGLHDNFFELGGNSLLAISLANQLSSEFGTQLEVRTVFEFQTAASLAEHLSALGPSSPTRRDIPRLPRVPFTPSAHAGASEETSS